MSVKVTHQSHLDIKNWRPIFQKLVVLFLLVFVSTKIFFRISSQPAKLPNIIYRKSHKTCSTSWMVWLEYNLIPEYCIVKAKDPGMALSQVRDNIGKCGDGSPLAILDHNDIKRSDLLQVNSRKTVIIDSIRDPITRIISVCKQMARKSNNLTEDEFCITDSAGMFKSYTYPPVGEETADNAIEFYLDCEEIENSICRLQKFMPKAIRKSIIRINSFNIRKRKLSIPLTNDLQVNLKNVTEEYIKAKVNIEMSKSKIKECAVQYTDEKVNHKLYTRYGRLRNPVK